MMQWLFTFSMASLSCVSMGVAIWCLCRVRKLLSGASTRSLASLSVEIAELNSAFESLLAGHKKLAARVGMREVRERRAEGPGPDPVTATVAETPLPRAKLKEIARARGFRVS